MNEASIFAAALEKPDAEERAAYLTQACASDARLRRRVEALLRAHAEPDEILDPPLTPTADGTPLDERPGSCIGPYKLLQQIGEGGMGAVFMAEQDRPVRRKVALKVIKPGMDSKQVVARFEAERQALAMMDHVNIARVFDAGATDSGRPYFVMELVHGVPITDYCDENKLTPRQRLELFVPVCQAIQHAHQKGIIHRDIKPSNVLVTMYDDKPVPKVIDFGVAKAVEQRLTEKTLFTQFGALVGTFEYMSPEQAEMNAFGVDTRSDVYALGVLLYELMTGTTPLERRRLREAAFDEIRRIIKEEEPPRPSVRLSTSGTLAKVAAARKTEPAKLSRLLRGELDWVVMKCLEKDRSRRYDTASNLARDVERFLKDEPVEARPPSAGYRLRKAIRRHRTALSVAGLVAAVVVLGAAVSLWQVSIARAERERAEIAEAKRLEDQAAADAALVAERRQNALDRAIEAALGSDPENARKAIVAAETAGVAADRVHWLRGLLHFQQGKLEEAIKEFESSIDLKPSVAACTMHGIALFDAAVYGGDGLTRFAREVKGDLLRSLKPETAEDYLFRGLTMGRFAACGIYQEVHFKSGQELDDIDRAIEMRDTAVAHAFRHLIAGQIAYRSGERELGLDEDPLAGIHEAKRRLPDNKFIRFISVYEHISVADLYDKANQPEKRKAALDEAGRDAQELKGITSCPYVIARVNYFERIGNTEAALQELEAASRLPETSDLVALYALLLYEQGQDTEALRVLNDSLKMKPDNAAGQMLQIILWAEDPNVGYEEAYHRYQALREERKREGKSSPFDSMPSPLLGKKWQVGVGDSLKGFAGALEAAQYMAGGSEEAFLKSAGKNPSLLCMSHLKVGLTRLANGDRKGAREHFEKAIATRFYNHMYYPYARAFLKRLERDDKWPKWIEPKK